MWLANLLIFFVVSKDGHDPDASLPAVVLLDGSGVVDYYGYTHEGDENLSLEQLM